MKTSIFSRIFGAIILVSFVAIFLVTFLNLRDQVEVFHDSVIREKSTLLTLLSWTAKENDDLIPENLFHKIAEESDVVFFWIMNEEGFIRYARNDDFIDKKVSDPFLGIEAINKRSAIYKDREIEVLGSPIKVKEGQNWTMLMGVGKVGVTTFFIPAFFRSFLIFSGALLVSVFLSLILTEKIINPLLKLRDMIAKIRKGEFSERIDISTGDEIEEIGNDFNKMTEDLERNKQELEESNQILEVRVRARTKELQELADTLEDKIEARTEELQRKVEELEKFHRLTVGREKKMIELKEENSELLEKNKKLKDELAKIKKE